MRFHGIPKAPKGLYGVNNNVDASSHQLLHFEIDQSRARKEVKKKEISAGSRGRNHPKDLIGADVPPPRRPDANRANLSDPRLLTSAFLPNIKRPLPPILFLFLKRLYFKESL